MSLYRIHVAEQNGHLCTITAKEGEHIPSYLNATPTELTIEADSEEEAERILYAMMNERYGDIATFFPESPR